MNKETTVVSYTLAALAGICFVQGLAILSYEKGMVGHGPNKRIRKHD